MINDTAAETLQQHYNATTHRGREVQKFLQQQQVDQFPLPEYSPYCNPIEHVWYTLDKAVRSRVIQPSNLVRALQVE